MNDKELLELAAKAAKAANIDGLIKGTAEGAVWLFRDDNGAPWNPLADDGDALRLAVDLKISIKFFGEHQSIASVGRDGSVKFYGKPMDGDFYERTRRAITRAAAEIGRNM